MQGIMTPEDFFTLTEMKDGLTGDATRQWSTVASTIAATENKDCLDLFLLLDGLCYFDSWLKDALKFGNETGDSFVDESITALLGAIEKLHIENQKSVTSGILMTVKNLLCHSSSGVKDKARALFDSWRQNSDSNVVPRDVEKLEAICEDRMNVRENRGAKLERPECSSHDISPSRGSDAEEKNVEPARYEMMPSVCSKTLQHEGVF